MAIHPCLPRTVLVYICFSGVIIFIFLFLKIYLFYLFLVLAALGRCCCVRAFSSFLRAGAPLHCGARASHCRGFFCCGARALGMRASVVGACGLSSCGLQALERRISSCGSRAQLLRGMWDLPRPGLEPVSPALAGGFLTTAPPGKGSPSGVIIFKTSTYSQKHSELDDNIYGPPPNHSFLRVWRKSASCFFLGGITVDVHQGVLLFLAYIPPLEKAFFSCQILRKRVEKLTRGYL